MPPTLCVAIVTARDNQHTSYDRWRSLREAFLNGRWEWGWNEAKYPMWHAGGRCVYPDLLGEFGALLTACLATPCVHSHIEYQLRALELQTRVPDDVLVVSRYNWPDMNEDGPPGVRWVQPMLSDREAADFPLSRLGAAIEVDRSRPVSYGCADKNTALVLNRCDYLLMLDDCCLPSPGTVAAAYEACAAGKVLLLGHKKISFDTRGALTSSTSNWNPESFATERNVFGIFAAPMDLILDINGWNTQLDGGIHDLDVELKFRMDALLRMRGCGVDGYTASRAARVYEIDHEHPWARGESVPWRPGENGAYPVRAPGINLRELRDAALATMASIEAQLNAQREEDDDGEED